MYGLAAARTYLQINPTVSVVVLESGDSLGGVWSKERLYPGLRLNNLLGTYEYSDFPMDTDVFDVKKGQHITGEATHRYLQAYAQEFGVYSKIRFGCKVEVVEKRDGSGWLLTYESRMEEGRSQFQSQIFARKLILATGAFSEPNIPEFEGEEAFDAPLIHSKEMAARQEQIISAKSVAVLAGSKSGYDAAYMAASRGVEVDWIIRESGRGAIWTSPPYVTPLKRWLEKLVNTRFFTWFSPCTWGDADGFIFTRQFLHETRFGRWIVDGFWKILGNDVLRLNNYDGNRETKKLKPWTDAFWSGSSFSILNYPTDFYDLVREGKIRVHVSDITHLSPGTVNLSNKESIKCDALICATGWKGFPPIKFLPEGIEAELGIPNRIPEILASDKVAFRVGGTIPQRFPRLLNRAAVINPYLKPEQKATSEKEEINTMRRTRPFRLYRHIAPPALINEHNIGFAGMVSNFSSLTCAQIQALWLTAYLDGKLPSPPTSVSFDSVLHSEYGRLRYPFGSPTNPDFVFDLVPYLDWLLGDLGLKVHRKSNLLAECFSPYGPEDYRGLVEEWRALEEDRTRCVKKFNSCNNS